MTTKGQKNKQSPNKKLAKLKNALVNYLKCIEENRERFYIEKEQDLDGVGATCPGVYWIETTMPVQKIQQAFLSLRPNSNEKKTRKNAPKGLKLIEQNEEELYIIYLGTHDNISLRFKQHLFNHGGEKTGKLGLQVDQKEFCKYKWCVSFHEIQDYEIRYAVEAGWRSTYGWPVFCLR